MSFYFIFIFYSQVKDRDTLEKIAAHFDTTPSELKKLNKLISAMIFSGQVNLEI